MNIIQRVMFSPVCMIEYTERYHCCAALHALAAVTNLYLYYTNLEISFMIVCHLPMSSYLRTVTTFVQCLNALLQVLALNSLKQNCSHNTKSSVHVKGH